jgi:hypothetical protein
MAMVSPANTMLAGMSTGEVYCRETTSTGCGTGVELMNSPQEITQTAINENIIARLVSADLFLCILFYFQN